MLMPDWSDSELLNSGSRRCLEEFQSYLGAALVVRIDNQDLNPSSLRGCERCAADQLFHTSSKGSASCSLADDSFFVGMQQLHVSDGNGQLEHFYQR